MTLLTISQLEELEIPEEPEMEVGHSLDKMVQAALLSS
jgi:hypothetical protein